MFLGVQRLQSFPKKLGYGLVSMVAKSSFAAELMVGATEIEPVTPPV